jgi:PAS domain S-box-containing protein
VTFSFASSDEGSQSGADREARLAFALEAGRLGYWELDLRTRELICSDIYKANWGRSPEAPFSYSELLRAIHPGDRETHEAWVEQAIAAHSMLDIEYRAVWPNGEVRWLRVRGEAKYGEDGTPQRMAGISLDITDRKQTEESLREETRTLEILQRTGAALASRLDLENLVQTITDAATQLSGAEFGSFFYNVLDARGESYMLYSLSGAPREAFSRFPMPRNTAIFDPTFKGEGIVRSADIRKDPRFGKNDPHYGMPKGHLPVVSYLAVPVMSRSGEVLGGLFFGHAAPGVFTERAERIVQGIAAQAAIAIDNARLFRAAQTEIAERRRAEEQQKLLLAELDHRVKNTLAIVQSIAAQTVRQATSPEDFRTGFEARLMALSAAHNLLTAGGWESASLRQIVEQVLSPYQHGEETAYRIDAEDDARVDPKTAVALVMAFHELATNAAKYGALSASSGVVSVSWRPIPALVRRLIVVWEESGGPPVMEPERRGFGSRLIDRLSRETGSPVEVEFKPTGLRCSFELPLSLGASRNAG